MDVPRENEGGRDNDRKGIHIDSLLLVFFASLSVQEQLRLKEAQVQDAFTRLAGFHDIQAIFNKIIGCEEIYYYRNKVGQSSRLEHKQTELRTEVSRVLVLSAPVLLVGLQMEFSFSTREWTVEKPDRPTPDDANSVSEASPPSPSQFQ